MEYLGKYYGREVFYLKRNKDSLNQLPIGNWQCLAIVNESYRREEVLEFGRKALKRDLLGVFFHGKYGGEMDTEFSLLCSDMEAQTELEIDVSIMSDTEVSLADAFWICFGSPALPVRTDYDKLKLICLSFDGKSYKKELTDYLNRFNEGWLPS